DSGDGRDTSQSPIRARLWNFQAEKACQSTRLASLEGGKWMYRFWLFSSLVLILVGVTASAQTVATTQLKQDKTPSAEDSALTGSWIQFNLDGSYLGVFLEEVTSDRVKELGLSQERGAIIMKVIKDSPAEKAGLKENDVIVSFNGRPVDSVREFERLLGDTPPNRTVAIEFLRGGSRQTVSATVTKRNDMGRARSYFGSAERLQQWQDFTPPRFEIPPLNNYFDATPGFSVMRPRLGI